MVVRAFNPSKCLLSSGQLLIINHVVEGDLVKRIILAAAVLAFAACKDSPTEPSIPSAAEMRITSPQTHLVVGSTVTLSASVYDRDGKKITNAPIEWRSTTPTIASTDA